MTATRRRDSVSQPAAIDNILYDAFGQREVAQYFTRQQGVLRRARGAAGSAGQLGTLQKLYVTSSSGQAVPLSTLVHQTRYRCSRWR